MITLKDEEDFIFIFNNFNFKAFILIINEDNKIFVIKIIAENDEIVNIVINEIQKSFFKTNMKFI